MRIEHLADWRGTYFLGCMGSVASVVGKLIDPERE